MYEDDKGHIELLKDIDKLVTAALAYEYHDFKTEKATPKINLVNILESFIEKVKAGTYDNEPQKEVNNDSN